MSKDITTNEVVSTSLRRAYPHGHPEFISVLVEKMKLHSDKNHDYAKGGNPLGNFERVAFILSQYPGLKLDDPVVVMLLYALKQVDAVLWGFAKGIEHKVEGPIERLGDVLVYAGIAICALKDRAEEDRIGNVEAADPVPFTTRWMTAAEMLASQGQVPAHVSLRF